MNTRIKVATGGVLLGLSLLALVGLARTTGVLFAQAPPPAPTMPAGQPFTHEQMHQMMDAMFGEGASARMHEAMGADAEQLMDQCVAMMNMMQGMMGGGMSGMMGNGTGQSPQGMIGGMMGR